MQDWGAGGINGKLQMCKIVEKIKFYSHFRQNSPEGILSDALPSEFLPMSLFLIQKRNRIGSVLVALQLGLMVLLPTLAAPTVLKGNMPIGTSLLAAVSLALFVWTLVHNRLGNFNIRPTPKSWGMLVTTGPYKQIRHPMYTSMLLGAASLALMSDPLLGWSAWSALALVLVVKSNLEERWLNEVHPGYSSYHRESKRFIPWVF